jgi:thiamine-phosphate pyrophosphorylase
MKRRQTLPSEWLIIAEQPAAGTWRSLRRLPSGSGILLLSDLSASERLRLRHLARSRALVLVEEASGDAARVHDLRELCRALLRRTALVLVSPLFPTASHADWTPLPRMRAAALARLAKRRAIALGGMNRKRYAKIAPLGFIGWAGISAFRT